MKPILLFSFQGIINQQPSGMVKGLIPIADSFISDNLNVHYYVGYIRGEYDRNYVSGISFIYSSFIRFYTLIAKRIFHVPYYKIRYISELFFDIFASYKIKKGCIVISSALLRRTLVKNKKLGGVNIFLAGNPDDCEIFSIYIEEENTFKITLHDAYSYKKRIYFVKKSTELYDHIVTYTKVSYDSLAKRIDNKKLSICFSPIFRSESFFQNLAIPKNNILTFCFIAHPFWLKGLPYLLEAWARIPITFDTQLLIAGNIDEIVQNVIDRNYYNLGNVKYLGWVNDLNAFYRSAHICIIPSLLDAGPQTILEAMYCRLPIIVSDKCGYSALVKDGYNGFVVPSRDPAAIADKIEWFCKNANVIQTMSTNAYDSIVNLRKNESNKNHIKELINKLSLNKI